MKAVLRGLVNGFKFALRDPAKAVDDILPLMEGGSRELELDRLRTVIRENILTDEVRRIGLGAIDPQRLGRAIQEVELKAGPRVTPEALFDDRFLPPPHPLRSHRRLRPHADPTYPRPSWSLPALMETKPGSSLLF